MNLGQLCDEIYVKTKRPELISETQLAVREATLFFHMIDFWMRDKIEKAIILNNPANNVQLSIPDNFVNWRKFNYIRKYDPVSKAVGDYIKFCDPSKMFDEYEIQKENIYYIAGQKINIKSSDVISGLVVGWYSFPDVMQYTSWIADMHPYAIIDWAAGKILNNLGYVEEANKILDPQKGTVYTMWLPLIRTNEIEPEAR